MERTYLSTKSKLLQSNLYLLYSNIRSITFTHFVKLNYKPQGKNVDNFKKCSEYAEDVHIEILNNETVDLDLKYLWCESIHILHKLKITHLNMKITSQGMDDEKADEDFVRFLLGLNNATTLSLNFEWIESLETEDLELFLLWNWKNVVDLSITCNIKLISVKREKLKEVAECIKSAGNLRQVCFKLPSPVSKSVRCNMTQKVRAVNASTVINNLLILKNDSYEGDQHILDCFKL